MSETLGVWTVDTAEGILKPALGVIKTSVDPAPPTYDTSLASGQVSTIRTARRFTTAALALAEAISYRTAVGNAILFRGVVCFVADVRPDHRAIHSSIGAGAIAEAEWDLVAPYTWVP